ncbi:MAG: PAS domain S-box protein [Nitrospirae bacterium]|nr:PAS domain S-box protein [Nitrospirota bacterium]
MKKLLSLSISAQLFLIVSIMGFFTFCIIIYSGINSRNDQIDYGIRESQDLANTVTTELQNLVNTAQQLTVLIAKLPDTARRNAVRMHETLDRVLKLNPQYSNIFVTDRTGNIWASAIVAKQKDLSDRLHFKKALSSGRFSSGEYIVSRFTGRPVLTFGYPFKDNRGEVLGVIILGIDLNYLKRVMDRLNLPEGSSYLLLDYKGVIMSRGNDDKFVGELYNQQRFNEMKEGPETRSFAALAHDGIQRYITYRKLQLEGEQAPFLYIRAGVPVDTVIAKANLALFRNLAIFVPSMLLVFCIAWFIGKRSIADRIAILEKSSRSLAEGDLQVRVSDVISGGELGGLGLTFDRMAREIAVREEALELKTLEQNAILESALVGIAYLKDRRFVWINSKMEQMFGYPMSEIIGQTTELFYPSHESYEQLGSEAYPVLAAGGTYYCERKMKRKDVSLFWCSISGKTIDPSVELSTGTIWILEDITERKQAEEKLTESNERFRSLVETTSDWIWELDESGIYTYVSPKVKDLLGYEQQEIIGKSPFDLMSQEEAKRVAEEFGAIVNARRLFAGLENTNLHKDGRLVVLETSGVPIFDAEGKFRGYRGIDRDITERKKAEEQIEQSLREKETLLRELYHRTKNNMQVITSLLGLQSRGIDDKKTLQILEDTKDRIQSMALVHEKLYKTKNLSQVYLDDYIKDLANALMKSHNVDKEQISVHTDVERIPVSIDTITPLGLVINELMTNALKYAFPDNKKGEIIIKGSLNEDEIIEITFSDNGIGMPQNINLKKTESLGLTIVRTLVVSQIKGKLEMQTNKGTAFIIKFKDKGLPART